ncbi:MAG: 2Fe-2S iron-sulfur cluster-binding protein [Jaaginema sp. PMC 1080.18]|nr:2Fe-2S iron-sulfur cluster-binding protein [Jaaginema sp. PMC 1080.18]MEC4867337.1 2Fe-2S iron-sulfur cluster-binding protein [Jaaginema sp. PMC 1078.18]
MTVTVRFLPDDVTVTAEVGEPMLTVADRAGVMIPTGCLMGSCHACEVELADGTSVCACLSSIPAGQAEVTINLYSDPLW